MRAITIDQPCPPEDLIVRDVPTPEPGHGEVRIRVAYCGLNPLDTFIRAGDASWMVQTWPVTLGLEHSGVIDRLGDGVDQALLGRRVAARGFGGYAEYSVQPITNLVPLPQEFDLLTGAVYGGCSHTAWRILHERLALAAGETILVHSAAGAVGIMLAQFAKIAGLRVIGTVSNATKAEYASKFGVDRVIDTSAEPDWAAAARSANGGAGMSAIVDGNGGAEAAYNIEAIAPNGTIVMIGASSGRQPAPTAVELLIMHHASLSGFSLPIAEKIGRPFADVNGIIVAAIADGSVRVPIGEVRPLEKTGRFHADLAARRLYGRCVIEVLGES